MSDVMNDALLLWVLRFSVLACAGALLCVFAGLLLEYRNIRRRDRAMQRLLDEMPCIPVDHLHQSRYPRYDLMLDHWDTK